MTAYPTTLSRPAYGRIGSRPAKTHEKDAGGIPWIVRPVTGQIELKVPYSQGNRDWMKSGFGTGKRLVVAPVKATNSWSVSRAHFDLAAQKLAGRYGKVEIYMQFSISQRCNSSCMGAKADECVCACLGTNHRGGLAPTRGWEIRGNMILTEGVTEVHSTLLRGHSMDGMFL